MTIETKGRSRTTAARLGLVALAALFAACGTPLKGAEPRDFRDLDGDQRRADDMEKWSVDHADASQEILDALESIRAGFSANDIGAIGAACTRLRALTDGELAGTPPPNEDFNREFQAAYGYFSQGATYCVQWVASPEGAQLARAEENLNLGSEHIRKGGIILGEIIGDAG